LKAQVPNSFHKPEAELLGFWLALKGQKLSESPNKQAIRLAGNHKFSRNSELPSCGLLKSYNSLANCNSQQA
jgi:hypothetical protein